MDPPYPKIYTQLDSNHAFATLSLTLLKNNGVMKKIRELMENLVALQAQLEVEVSIRL